jgi:hypothetical protein
LVNSRVISCDDIHDGDIVHLYLKLPGGSRRRVGYDPCVEEGFTESSEEEMEEYFNDRLYMKDDQFKEVLSRKEVYEEKLFDLPMLKAKEYVSKPLQVVIGDNPCLLPSVGSGSGLGKSVGPGADVGGNKIGNGLVRPSLAPVVRKGGPVVVRRNDCPVKKIEVCLKQDSRDSDCCKELAPVVEPFDCAPVDDVSLCKGIRSSGDSPGDMLKGAGWTGQSIGWGQALSRYGKVPQPALSRTVPLAEEEKKSDPLRLVVQEC